MILHDFACPGGHRFEAGLASMSAADPDCPACGSPSRRRPSRLNVGGAASTGPSREQMPRSWSALRGGDRETIAHWRTVAQRREKLEEKHPELAGDRRPVLAHEGIFAGRPLRAGDDVPAAVTAATAAARTAQTTPTASSATTSGSVQ